MVVAYLTNQFPSPLEPYVAHEIRELRRRGVTVIPCSARRAAHPLGDDLQALAAETQYLQPLTFALLMRAAWLCLRQFAVLRPLLCRLWSGAEPPARRLRALLHTWLGACYALRLEGYEVEHIHVHHGYFASWIAMVAARLRGVGFSMTLHGSDLLLHPAYLDTKLKDCIFCATISEFNRRHLLSRYPDVEPDKIVLQRMGIDCHENGLPIRRPRAEDRGLVMLAVGRLHPVKDYPFLVRACRRLKDGGVCVSCLIAGDGPERPRLERMIHHLDLHREIRLLGHVSHTSLGAYYSAADLVVLTSRSEGIPLVLMEAMSHGTPTLAPAITGIPELVIEGQTGFLYQPGSLEHFAAQIELVLRSRPLLDPMRWAARRHVAEHFNREQTLPAFCDLLLGRIGRTAEKRSYESPLLQQV